MSLTSRRVEASRETTSKPSPALSNEELLEGILVELKIMNRHLAAITDETIIESEVQE